jgi:hypothetical protein
LSRRDVYDDCAVVDKFHRTLMCHQILCHDTEIKLKKNQAMAARPTPSVAAHFYQRLVIMPVLNDGG